MGTNIKSLDELPPVLRPHDIARALNLSRSAVYTIIKKASFPKMRLGKAILIHKNTFLQWLDTLNQGG
jgi:excisionase family DNA binding protein